MLHSKATRGGARKVAHLGVAAEPLRAHLALPLVAGDAQPSGATGGPPMLRAPSVANVPISRVMWVGLDGIAAHSKAHCKHREFGVRYIVAA